MIGISAQVLRFQKPAPTREKLQHLWRNRGYAIGGLMMGLDTITARIDEMLQLGIEMCCCI